MKKASASSLRKGKKGPWGEITASRGVRKSSLGGEFLRKVKGSSTYEKGGPYFEI